MEKASIGIVITSYERPTYLGYTLDSLKDFHGDVHVFDDGSSFTSEIIDAVGACRPSGTLTLGTNVGLYRHLRRSVEKVLSRYEYDLIVLAQDDVEFLPGWEPETRRLMGSAGKDIAALSLIVGTLQMERKTIDWDSIPRRIRRSRYNVPLVATVVWRSVLEELLLKKWTQEPPVPHKAHRSIDGLFSKRLKSLGYKLGFAYPPLALHMDQPDHPACLRDTTYAEHTKKILERRWGEQGAKDLLRKEKGHVAQGTWHFSDLDYFLD